MNLAASTRHARSFAALGALAPLMLAACAAGSAVTPAPTSSAVASPSAAPSSVAVAPSAVPTPSATTSPSPEPPSAPASGSPLATAVPTSIDPCQLITADDAGALASAKFGPGKEEKLAGNSRMCTYGGNTANVFEVIVAIAPDEATAKKAEASAEADAKANAGRLQGGLTITKLPNFDMGADAVILALKPNALGIAGRGIYVLRGTTFFGFNDLVRGGKAPSAEAMKAKALELLASLP
jgi:hypothetical protein